jgi:hypothetical protein
MRSACTSSACAEERAKLNNLESPVKKFFSTTLLGFFFGDIMRQENIDRDCQKGKGR